MSLKDRDILLTTFYYRCCCFYDFIDAGAFQHPPQTHLRKHNFSVFDARI